MLAKNKTIAQKYIFPRKFGIFLFEMLIYYYYAIEKNCL